MKTYTDHIIENKATQSRARSLQKKNNLRRQIKEKINYNAPKCLTIKELEQILNG